MEAKTEEAKASESPEQQEAAAETQADSKPEEQKDERVRSRRRKQEEAQASPTGLYARLANINKDIENKYPKLAKKIDYFKEVWAETFPNSDVKINNKMEQRRK